MVVVVVGVAVAVLVATPVVKPVVVVPVVVVTGAEVLAVAVPVTLDDVVAMALLLPEVVGVPTADEEVLLVDDDDDEVVVVGAPVSVITGYV